MTVNLDTVPADIMVDLTSAHEAFPDEYPDPWAADSFETKRDIAHKWAQWNGIPTSYADLIFNLARGVVE